MLDTQGECKASWLAWLELACAQHAHRLLINTVLQVAQTDLQKAELKHADLHDRQHKVQHEGTVKAGPDALEKLYLLTELAFGR